jgi:hypothetical protein
MEPDDGPSPFLSIPKDANNKEMKMFSHPYSPMAR